MKREVKLMKDFILCSSGNTLYKDGNQFIAFSEQILHVWGVDRMGTRNDFNTTKGFAQFLQRYFHFMNKIVPRFGSLRLAVL